MRRCPLRSYFESSVLSLSIGVGIPAVRLTSGDRQSLLDDS